MSANVLYIFCIVRSLFCWKADITQCNSDSISNTNTLCVIISRVTKSGATVRADTWGDFWSRPPSVVDQPLKKLHRSINCCTGKAKLIIRYFLLDKFFKVFAVYTTLSKTLDMAVVLSVFYFSFCLLCMRDRNIRVCILIKGMNAVDRY